MTVTRPVASGKSVLILAGASGNWTIKEGSADASTLTVGATCPEAPNAGVRNANAVVGKVAAPLLWVVVLDGVGVPVENGAFEGIVIQYLLRILQLGEPHAKVLQVYARGYSLLSIL